MCVLVFTTNLYKTSDDAIIVVDGLILYILIVAADNPDEHTMPWLFTSDACEQLHAFLRIGIHAGMKTKLCCKDMLVWASQTGDAIGECLIPETVANSCNKLLIPHPKLEKLY